MISIPRRILLSLFLLSFGAIGAAQPAALSELQLPEESRAGRIVRIPPIADYTQADFEHFVIKRGDADESLSISGPENARMFRYQLSATAKSVGFSRILQWRNLQLGLSYDGEYWRLHAKDGEGWAETEFAVAAGDILPWVTLDIVRRDGEAGVSECLIFVDGARVSNALELNLRDVSRGLMRAKVFQASFADIRVSGLGLSETNPEFSQRASMRERVIRKTAQASEPDSEPDGGIPLEVASQMVQNRTQLSDEKRREMWEYPQFAPQYHSGDLSFTERAWVPTRTLNRSIFSWDETFDIQNASRYEPYLRTVVADYLPPFESRAWESPFRYFDIGDQFIEKIYGYLLVEQTGDYRLAIDTDESAILFVSENFSAGSDGDLVPVARFVGTDGRDSGLSSVIHLDSDKPVYFELWRVETSGADWLSVQWISETDEVFDISSTNLSSYTAGAPGSAFRNIGYADASLLDQPDRIPSLRDVIEENLYPVGNFLRGTEALEKWFFIEDGDQWLQHAYSDNGQGLGWLYHAGGSNWPNSIWSSTYNAYLNYTAASVEPQWFWRTDVGMWFRYDHTPTPKLSTFAVDYPQVWDFETETLVDWENEGGDSDDWYRHHGSTGSSGTGPSHDHTTGTGVGSYVYLETSSSATIDGEQVFGAYNDDDTAILGSPIVLVPSGGITLSFAYHMYGADMGALYLEANSGSGFSTIWSRSGQQHSSSASAFGVANVSLNSFAGKYVKLQFRAVAVGGYRGDMALDDVMLYVNGADTDGDSIADSLEMKTYKTDPNASDSDGDSLSDYDEIYNYVTDPRVSDVQSGDLVVF